MTIEHRQEELDAIHAEIFGPQGDPSPQQNPGDAGGSPTRGHGSLDDQDIIRRAMEAWNGAKFRQLWEGDTSAHPSPSEADLALCSHLGFWTRGDPVAVDRLFRQSGLFRAKWDEKHGSETYGAMTIARALEGTRSYVGMPSSSGTNGHQRANVPKDDRTPVPMRHATDLGNGERLFDQHGTDLRYCHPWTKWSVWDGYHWQVDNTAEVHRRAQHVIRNIYEEAANLARQASEELGDERRKEMATHAESLSVWARKSEFRPRIEAMIQIAESQLSIPVLPEELDANPWLLNVLNGTIDLQTGKMREHRREDLITKLAPVEYDPEAKCPRFDAFLERVMDGDRERIDYLQRAVGYTLTGIIREHLLFVLWGLGRNGKSVFIEAILGMLGDYGRKAPPDLLMVKKGEVHPTERAVLHGARFVPVVETGEGRWLHEVTVKELTGSDTISARRMREDFWEFEPTHHLWMATNHKPTIKGTDEGIWSRISLVNFNVFIPEAERDRSLGEKLKAEWSGILAWAVRGCLAWQRDGLQEPTAVKEATARYRSDMDVLGDFIEEKCVEFPEAWAKVSELYKAYDTWAKASGEKALNKKDFGTRLGERGFESKRGAQGAWLRRGVGLLGEDEPPQQGELDQSDDPEY